MTQPTDTPNKPSGPDKEAQRIYDECWKMYRQGRLSLRKESPGADAVGGRCTGEDAKPA